MLSLPLLVTTLALAPTGGDSRFELSLGTNIQVTPVAADFAEPALAAASTRPATVTARSRSLAAGSSTTTRRSPCSRSFSASRSLHIDGGGGGYQRCHRIAGSSMASRATARTATSPSRVSVYLDRHLYGYLSAGVDYNDRLDTYTFSGSTTSQHHAHHPARRRRRCALWRRSWSRCRLARHAHPPRHRQPSTCPSGAAPGSTPTRVVRRRVCLVAEVDVDDGGAGAYARASVYLARRFCLGAFVRGSQARTASNGFQTTQDHAGAGVDLEAWRTPRLRFRPQLLVSIGMRFTRRQRPRRQTDYESVIGLSIRLRPR